MKSATILNVLLIGAMCLGLTMAKRAGVAKLRADNSLMEFMLNTRAFQARTPLRSMQCFNYYTPLLNEITNKYEFEYEACLKASDESLSKLNNSTAAQRNSLNNLATSSCSAIANCYALSDAISSFECYEGVSNTNTKDFYSISSTASEELLNIREQFRIIELNEYRCTNASERVYVQSTTETYEQLQSCLAGLSPVPTTTVAPTTTTINTTTVAPVTTQVPVVVTTKVPVIVSTNTPVPSENVTSEAPPADVPYTY